MNKSPLISVLMPTFNAAKYLKKSIDSILNQTFKDFEFIIINDGSEDESVNVIKRFSDSRIKFIDGEQNLGLICRLNQGLEIAKGKYLIRMDADDISNQYRFERQLSFMEKNKEISICGSWAKVIGNRNFKNKPPINDTDIKLKLIEKCVPIHATTIIRKSIFIENQVSYNSAFKHAEDYKLWIDFASNVKFSNLSQFLYIIRSHENNVSKKFQNVQRKNTKYLRIEYLKKIFQNQLPKRQVELLLHIIDEKEFHSIEDFFYCIELIRYIDKIENFNIVSTNAFKSFIKFKFWLSLTSSYKIGKEIYMASRDDLKFLDIGLYNRFKFYLKASFSNLL
ncbi:MAG: glycosyltransferase [Cytophagales bacterium]|nr:glycosyltransferase [Cytophagales bacterium]